MFICFQKCAQTNGPPKTITFHILQKHRLIKNNRFVATPPFHQKIVFFKLFVLKPKTFMLNKKHDLKSGKQNKDKEKGLERKNKTRNYKKDKRLMKNIKANLKLSCCSFQKTKAKQKEKMKKRQKQETKRNRKKIDKKEERKTRARERQRKRNRKRGKSKKVEGERKRNTENKQKMPFLGGKQGFSIKSKERKGTKKKPK